MDVVELSNYAKKKGGKLLSFDSETKLVKFICEKKNEFQMLWKEKIRHKSWCNCGCSGPKRSIEKILDKVSASNCRLLKDKFVVNKPNFVVECNDCNCNFVTSSTFLRNGNPGHVCPAKNDSLMKYINYLSIKDGAEIIDMDRCSVTIRCRNKNTSRVIFSSVVTRNKLCQEKCCAVGFQVSDEKNRKLKNLGLLALRNWSLLGGIPDRSRSSIDCLCSCGTRVLFHKGDGTCPSHSCRTAGKELSFNECVFGHEFIARTKISCPICYETQISSAEL